MAGSYPAIGLTIDLAEIVRAKAEISGLAASYKDLADAAAASGAAATAAATGHASRGGGASAASDQTIAASKAAASAQIADEGAVTTAVDAATRARINLTKQMFDSETVAAQASGGSQRAEMTATLAFQQRMTAQRVAEAQAAADAEISAAAVSAREQEKAFQYLNSMKVRYFVAAQSAAEKEAAAEIAAAEKSAAAQIAAAEKVAAAQEVLRNRINRAVATGSGGMATGLAFDAAKFGPSFAAEMAPAIASLEQMNVSFGHVAGGSRGALYELQVISHELTAGRFRQALSSSTILLQKLAVPLGLAVGFAIAATMALSMVKSLDATVTSYEKLHNASVTLGLDVATLQNLGVAAEQFGIKTDAVTNGIGRLDQAFARARGGAKQQVDGFNALNISLKDNYTNGELLTKVLEGWDKLGGDGPRKVAIATELFGRSGRELIPVLDDLSKHYAEIDAKATLYGVHNEQAVINGAQLAGSFKDAGIAMQGLGATMLGLAGGGMAAMLDGFNHLIAQTVAWLNQRSTIEAYKNTMSALGSVFGALGSALALVASNWVVLVAILVAVNAGAILNSTIIVGLRLAWINLSEAVLASAASMTIGADAMAAASAAGGRLMAFLGGPLGIALIAGAAAWSVFSNAIDLASHAQDDFRSNQQNGIAALQKAADFSKQYSQNTDVLTHSLSDVANAGNTATTAANDNAAANSAGADSAMTFARAQEVLALSSLAAAAALDSAQASKQRSAAGALRVGGFLDTYADPKTSAWEYQQSSVLDRAATQNSQMANALSKAQTGMANQPLVLPSPGTTAGDPTKTGKSGAGQADSAQAGIDKLTDSIKLLNAQLDTAASFNLNPLADDTAKIQKAYDDALAKYSDTTNAYKNGLAVTYANMAADKERLTLTVALSEGFLKEARALTLKNQETQFATEAILAGHVALDAYYQSGVSGSAAFITALTAQANALLEGKNRATDLAIAQKFGVTSIDEISAASQKTLGISKQRADQLQIEAQRTADLGHEQNRLAEIQKAETSLADEHTKDLETIADLTKQAAAYKAGADALALYDRQKIIDAAIAKSGGVITPQAQYAAYISGGDPATIQALAIERDKEKTFQEQSILNQTKLDFQVSEELRLATLTTAQRAVDKEVQAQITLETQAEKHALDDATKAMIQQDVLRKQAIIDTAQIITKTQDAIETAFVTSNRLDFSSLGQALTQTFRKAVYDALLAKPIDIIVNAMVNIETQLLQSVLGSALGTAGGAWGALGTGGAGGIMGSLFGAGGSSPTGTDPFFAATSGATGAIGGLTKSLSSLSSVIAPVAAAFAIGQIGSSLAQAVTGDHGPGAQIGGNLFGFIGGLIGSLFDNKATNAGAGANFDQFGNPTYVQDGTKATAQTLGWAQTIGQGVQQTMAQLLQLGINATGVIQSFGIGVRDPSNLHLRNGQVINTPAGDPTALSNAIGIAMLQYATYKDPQEQALVQQMITANDSLSAITTALQGYVQAQKDIQNVHLGLLQYTDPTQYAVQSLQVTQLATRTTLTNEIAAGYFTPAQIAQIATELPQLETYQIQAALAGVANGATGAAHSLQDFITAQKAVIAYVTTLKTGPLSPLAPQAQLALNQATYQTDLTGALGGNYDALSAITTDAGNYLTQAQKVFGSGSAYAAIFNQVTSDLSGLGTAVITPGSGSAATVAAIKAAQDALTAAIAAQGLAIVNAINNTNTPSAANNNLPAGWGGFTQDQINQIKAALAANGETIASITANGFAGLIGSQDFYARIQAALKGGIAA